MPTNDQRVFTRTAMATRRYNIQPKLTRTGPRL